MFTLAMAARERERGVVGSTSDILGFIATKLKAAMQLPFPERLQVFLPFTVPARLYRSVVVSVCTLLFSPAL